MAPLENNTRNDGSNFEPNNKDVTASRVTASHQQEDSKAVKNATTALEKTGKVHGETLPGWTSMQPLRLARLKGKKDDQKGIVGKDSKSTMMDEAGEMSNGQDIEDVRSLDGLLDNDRPSRTRNTTPNHDPIEDVGNVAGSEVYKVYKRRWFGLVQLVLLNIVVSWDWLSFSANSTTASRYYRVSPTAINWLSTGFLFAFVVVSPIVLFTLHRGGPKMSIVAASGLLLIGNWIRYGATRSGSHGSFPAVMFGQILCGFAQPFVLAAPTQYSDLWFSNRGRVAATAVMSLANPLGGAIAQLLGPELGKNPQDIPFMVLIIAVVATAACIPSFFLPAKPPTPSSASAATPKQDVLPSIRYLAKLPEFYMVAIPFAFYVGLFNSLSSLINQFLQPYKFTETEAGIAGALLIVVGLVAAAITSPIIDKTKSYLLAIKILAPFIGLAYLAFTFAPSSRNVAAPYVILAVLGASSFSLVPVVLEYVIELTHPVSPEVTSTICWTIGQLLGGIFIIISGALRAPGKSDGSEDNGTSRPPGNMYNALIFQTVMAMVALPAPLMLGLFGRKEAVRMRRVEADREAAQRREQSGY